MRDFQDPTVRDQIVTGITDDSTRRRLLQTRKLDLKTSIDICRAAESAVSQSRVISDEDVHLIKQKSTSTARRSPVDFEIRPQKQLHRRKSADIVDDNKRIGKHVPFSERLVKAVESHTLQQCAEASLHIELDDQFLATKSRQSCRRLSKLVVAGEKVQFMLDSGWPIFCFEVF